MMRLRFFNALILLFVLTGCGATYHYAEFIKPSKAYIPSKVYYVGVINRAASEKSTAAIKVNDIPYDYVKGLPTRTAEKTIENWKKQVEEIGRYKVIEIEWDLKNRDSKRFAATAFTAQEIDSLCEWHEVDGILSLDGIEMTINTSGDVEVISTTDDAGMPVRVPEFTRQQEVALTVLWRFYDGYSLKKANEYQESYRRFFNQLSSNPEENANEATDLSLEGIAQVAALDYAEQVAPYWEEDHRLYYRGHTNDLVVTSDNLEYNGDWQRAAREWKDLVNSDDEKERYYSRYNMAVASEMLGRPRAGKEWLLKAKEVNHTKQVDKYMDILERQILIYDVVDRQLGLQ